MKKCASCGQDAPDWVAACSNCRTLFGGPRVSGAILPPPAQTLPPRVVQALPSTGPDTRKVPGIAIAALVLCFVCFPMVGAIVAIPALRKINDAPHLYKGKGLAVAALVIGIGWTVLVVAGVAIALLVD